MAECQEFLALAFEIAYKLLEVLEKKNISERSKDTSYCFPPKCDANLLNSVQIYVTDLMTLEIGLQVTCAAAQNVKENGDPATGEETK